MSRKRERVIPDVILIDFSKLKLALHNYERLKALKHNWTTPFGIALSLLLTILVSDFKEKMGLAGQCKPAKGGLLIHGHPVAHKATFTAHQRTAEYPR